MAIVLSLDLETEWLEPMDIPNTRAIEVGAVLYCTDSNKPLELVNMLINQDIDIPQKLTDLTGITKDMITKYGKSAKEVYTKLSKLMKHAEYLIGHNSNEFDYPILDAEFKRHDVHMPMIPRIDSRVDIPYPDSIKTRKLTWLAAELGFVNPYQHRALFDCLTTLKVMSQFNFKDIVELSKQPTVTAIARVSYQDRDLAKQAGFYWDGDNKRWFQRIKKGKALALENQVSFPLVLLEE